MYTVVKNRTVLYAGSYYKFRVGKPNPANVPQSLIDMLADNGVVILPKVKEVKADKPKFKVNKPKLEVIEDEHIIEEEGIFNFNRKEDED